MRVLFLTTLLPARKLHGSEVASQNIVDGLRQNGCQVFVVGYGRKEDGELHQAKDEILVEERSVETKKAKLRAALWFASSLLKGLPYSSEKYYSKQYIKQVRSLLKQDQYDAIVIDHAQLGWLLKIVGSEKTIHVSHNLEHEMYQQHFKNSRNAIAQWIYQREARLIQNMENNLGNTVTEVWTLTQHDADYFAHLPRVNQVRPLSLPSSFATVPARLPTKKFDIGIIGSWSWKPNEEGLRWFLETVYPCLPKHVSIHVAGRGADWLADQYPNLVYRGFVEDAQVFMSQARAIAIPTLSGGGIQIKTLDAIASGSLIVGTPIALRGIDHLPQTVSIVQHPEAFAQRLMDAVKSPHQLQAFDDARCWCQTRQNQFVREIAQAMGELRERRSFALR